ncbi:MAG: endonuclease/exonuclease/phosphatase family protein [Thermoplasmatales archaeon]|nr:endonuclease/exonuclease/phosphatase family protein [Thermoplasmatales archaeon]
MVRIASFNVENLFARPKAFNPTDWNYGLKVLNAYRDVNALLSKYSYSDADKQQIRDLFVVLDIYTINNNGAIRRKRTQYPRWAWFRKNKGNFDRQPKDTTQNVEIIAKGRADWIGWVELAKETTNEISTLMTARVIQDVGADIIGIVEAEDRPSLVRFNDDLLDELYSHVMLIDGNDKRGIDVGIMTRDKFEIESIRSNVDTVDAIGTVFSRDCPQYKISTPNGTEVHILVNHFKSKSGGGGGVKRQRQATEVRRIVDRLVAQGKHVIVLGDLNEGPATDGSQAADLINLFNNNSPLVDCFALQGFQFGNRPGTYNSCTLRNRFDYILISQSLHLYFIGGGVFRKGLWGNGVRKPKNWDIYSDMTKSSEQASDHAAVFVDLNI